MSLESPQNKSELIEVCKIRLGYPALRINVHEAQYNLRVREAVNLFTQWHYQATEPVIVAQKITTQDRINGYFTPTDESIVAVTDVISYSGGFFQGAIIDAAHTAVQMTSPFFSIQSNSQFDQSQSPMFSIFMMQFGLANWENIMRSASEFTYNPISRKLQIFTDPSSFNVGQYIIYRAHSTLEGIADSPFWANDWLIRYTTELIKLQWGTNMSKFQAMQMPGGMEFNGKDLVSEAKEEIKALREELMTNYVMYPAMSLA